MPDTKKVFGSGFDLDFNLLIFLLIALTMIGNYWMLQNKIDTGTIYFFMVLGVIGVYVLAEMFLKGIQFHKITKFMRAPFGVSLKLAVFFYVIGWAIVPITGLIGYLLKSGFSAVSFSIPLFGNEIISGTAQSFAVAQIADSVPWTIFNVSFNAGATEEFVFSFGLMIAGVLIGLLLTELLIKKDSILGLSKGTFITTFAVLFSTILFMGAHALNSTYTGIMFLYAGIFKLISLVSIYFYGIFLTFWIGWHQANNLSFLIEQYGWGTIFNGFVSWFGLFFVSFFLILLLYLARNWEGVKSEFISYWRK